MRLGENRLTQIRTGFEQMVSQGYPLGPYGMELLAEIDALRDERDNAHIDERARIVAYLSERSERVGGAESGLLQELCDQIRALP